MTPVHLVDAAAALPQAWSSRVLAQFGGTRLKLVRMDDTAYPEEIHDDDEGLLVLDGVMLLRIHGDTVTVGAGELCIIPAGTPHSVEAGSHGTLLILDT
ncbi:cupin domain-containing protein [Dyella telluris]|uniref:Cupin domain-containing protein n=1 Tax=Dyella telluris TaxID=2763498 RepID=A0A7G8Q9Z8_9GAMM|nr:cupin domain-containing protein [Dyella telluris]QNK03606.1 cupin domain-containing protein [Dyella telluris]